MHFLFKILVEESFEKGKPVRKAGAQNHRARGVLDSGVAGRYQLKPPYFHTSSATIPFSAPGHVFRFV
jgi:hypothetical protein